MKTILIVIIAFFLAGCSFDKLDWDKFIEENGSDKDVFEIDIDTIDDIDIEQPKKDNDIAEIDDEATIDEDINDLENDEGSDTDIADVDEAIFDDDFIDEDVNDADIVDDEFISDENTDEDIIPVDPEMVLVPAGEFWMGCNEVVDLECENDEKPYHKVFLNSYNIDIYEVTAGEYKECVTAGDCTSAATAAELGPNCNYEADGKENHPINCVDWSQAESYCKWKGKRLPTEAEWEKAARGTDGRKHPWGNLKESCNYAVISEAISGGNGCGTNGTMEVGSKVLGISPYGVHDLIGNVWEWVADWYSSDYYSISPEINPIGPITGTHKIIRGGSWYGDSEGYLRSSSRNFVSLDHQSISSGFRCAKSVQMVSCTGITKCYNDTEEINCPASGDFYGQDAQYLDKCVPRSYTISGTNPQEIVTDNNTDLQWQRTLPTSYSGCTGGNPVGTQCRWQEAINYCDGLNYGGYEDWRLPNIKEINSLAYFGMNGVPSIDSFFFPDTPLDYFWSYSSYFNDSARAWYISFFANSGLNIVEKTQGRFVRCMRGDHSFQSDFEETEINGKTIVSDKSTGLIWTKDYLKITGINLTWKMALDHCANLLYAGFDDWRLPSILELITIIDHSKHNPASDFPGIEAFPYWTSSSYNSESWKVDFYNGATNYSTKLSNANAICVR